jgi:methionyl-tRNA formyltransferase
MMPAFWQLLHGEERATITVHDMAERLDAGAVLGISEFGLRQRDSLHRVIVGTKLAGAKLMINVLRQIADGTVKPRSLDMASAGYFSFPTSAHVRAFRSKGHRLL